MYWFNIKAMAEDLKMDRLSQKEQVAYFFLGVGLRLFLLCWVLWFSLEIDLIGIFDKVLPLNEDMSRSLFSAVFPQSFRDYHVIRVRSVVPMGVWALGSWILMIFMGRGFCYWLNRMGDNGNFIERVTLMSFPILVRVIIFSLALGLLAWIVSRVLQLFSVYYSIDFGFSYIVFLVFVLLYYLWLGIWISRISSLKWREVLRRR